MMLHYLFCGFGRQFVCLWQVFVSLRLSFDHECDLEHEHFSADHRILLVSVHGSDVIR